jgi:16S rRNA U516 pseudouridylate synthase RsuA-like enzyme
LIFSDDGDVINNFQNYSTKCYKVTAKHPVTIEKLEEIKKGVYLNNEKNLSRIIYYDVILLIIKPGTKLNSKEKGDQ